MTHATVLLADDEDTLRNNVAQVLQEEGFDVIACPDGTEALRALKSNSIDAIITDLRMPGLPGMGLIDHAIKLMPEVVIIVITAYGEVETAVEAMKKGAKDYICKPLIFDEELKCNCPGFSAEALGAMCRHPWPGNVRELENVVERALIFAGNDPVEMQDLPATICSASVSRPSATDLRSAGREFERQYIIKTLTQCGSNKAAAAEALGIGLSSLYRKMDELQIAGNNNEQAAEEKISE
ncbi:MAG: response regulator [Planctomycetota bacterium]